ncbi:hypothetical protein PV327_011135, partial [Microctonus hyperodae]
NRIIDDGIRISSQCNKRNMPWSDVDLISASKNTTMKIWMKSVKIESSSFFAVHNWPVSVVVHLIPLMNRRAAETFEETVILRRSKFYVMIDESTTIASKKLLYVLVKVMRPNRIELQYNVLTR